MRSGGSLSDGHAGGQGEAGAGAGLDICTILQTVKINKIMGTKTQNGQRNYYFLQKFVLPIDFLFL